MELDSIDIKILNENFEENLLNELDSENVKKIYDYLIKENVYYAKDIFISNADLFLMKYEEFINKFEHLKNKLGDNYVERLGEDCSLIEIMYE